MHASAIDEFCRQHFNRHLNFHRPCGVPEMVTSRKGKQRRVYRWYATPFEILRQMPDLARHLKEDIPVAELERVAGADSDTAAAQKMQKAKQTVFDGTHRKRPA